MHPRGMATDGHYYFDAPTHADVATITDILRQGLLKGLSHHTLVDKVPTTSLRWKHIAPLPIAGPKWNLEDWTTQISPEIQVSDRMIFTYRSAYVTIDPWSVLSALSPAPRRPSRYCSHCLRRVILESHMQMQMTWSIWPQLLICSRSR